VSREWKQCRKHGCKELAGGAKRGFQPAYCSKAHYHAVYYRTVTIQKRRQAKVDRRLARLRFRLPIPACLDPTP